MFLLLDYSPETKTYLARIEQEKIEKVKGAKQDNRSFLAKYVSFFFVLFTSETVKLFRSGHFSHTFTMNNCLCCFVLIFLINSGCTSFLLSSLCSFHRLLIPKAAHHSSFLKRISLSLSHSLSSLMFLELLYIYVSIYILERINQ